MPVDEIFIEAGPGEIRAAFLDAGTLVRLAVEREGGPLRPGDVVLGRVTGLAPAVEAAFVEIGEARPGFLGLAEARPAGASGGRIGDFVGEGGAVLVQVQRAAEAGKGAKLTRRPGLAGRFLVFLPEDLGVRQSRRIPKAARGVDRWQAVLPAGAGGWLIRRAAADAEAEELEREAAALQDAWSRLREASVQARPPHRVMRAPDPVTEALRQESTASVRRIVAGDAASAASARAAIPDLAERIEIAHSSTALFEAEGIAEQIEALGEPKILLPSGGAIHVALTPALIAVDVDTGAASRGSAEDTALTVNREAVQALARRLRAADLGGYAIVDLVPMRRQEHRRQVVDALRAAVAEDPRDVQVGGITRFGRLELTRRREGPSFVDLTTEPCPACEGRGRVPAARTAALEALCAVLAADRGEPGQSWVIVADPAVCAALEGEAAIARRRAEERLGRPVAVNPDTSLSHRGFRVEPARTRARSRA